MTSTIQVKEKTVNNREVISFSKEYSGEEHEVFAPKEQATQVLLSILAILNEDKKNGNQYILTRKGDIGAADASVVDGDMLKADVVETVVRELYDENTAKAVNTILNGDSNE